ncbi:hypothetical protein F4803DRAFT_514699 [Xylaria telfairii]|nr:hypothetical protein F4803DRAFT_514699 [Xylaria telfairii]
MAAGVPSAADIALVLDHTQAEHPNRYNLGLPFNTCYKEPCLVRSNLMRCGGCRAVMYCTAQHQRADWPRHKNQCRLIKPAREELAVAEAALRAMGAEAIATGSDSDDPEGEREDPFTSPLTRGRLYLYPSARPYMQARHNVISATLNVRTGESADIALEHCNEMLQLNRGDNQSVRDQVPSLMLRTGRDQEAYDFLKWYLVRSRGYQYGDNTQPFLDLKGEDAFESPRQEWLNHSISLVHLAALTHLKTRLLLDIRMLAKHGRTEPDATYEKKMEWIREDACSNILYSRRDIVDLGTAEHANLATELETQVKDVHRRVKELNKHYWPALSHPERYSHALPTIYSLGSPQEVILAFRYTWYMWSECEPVMQYVMRLA